nr:putative SWI/SNF-related matrix-associated actin-dependent regulator of chromatin subfamily A member 3-like 3 [Ipomoea batatas]
MALLGQWMDELEAHSKPDSISVFVHYGGDISNDPRVIAEPDVVLTTYGLLTAAYKADGGSSIFHKVDWHRIVLDEAHTIKSWRTMSARAAFTLSVHCRWSLTGTPLQNNVQDLYSLMCFLHVEPWCNWAWWNELIQRPYENGDQRASKLIKAILRQLMLSRTKEIKDKEGRIFLLNGSIALSPCMEDLNFDHSLVAEIFRCGSKIPDADHLQQKNIHAEISFDGLLEFLNLLLLKEYRVMGNGLYFVKLRHDWRLLQWLLWDSGARHIGKCTGHKISGFEILKSQIGRKNQPTEFGTISPPNCVTEIIECHKPNGNCVLQSASIAFGHDLVREKGFPIDSQPSKACGNDTWQKNRVHWELVSQGLTHHFTRHGCSYSPE